MEGQSDFGKNEQLRKSFVKTIESVNTQRKRGIYNTMKKSDK